MSRQSFIKGTLILLAAGIINRILGFVPRIALPRIIGAEGVGLYQMAYPLMIVIITIIAGGIPLAVAKLVSEADAEGNRHKIKSILKNALTIVITLSVLFTLICVNFASWMTSHWFTDERVYYSFIAMIPIFVIVAVSSVYRGYFQGLHNMIPTAVSQLSETAVRIVAVLFFAYLLLPYGVHYAAAGAMAGVVIGELGGFIVLYVQYASDRRRNPFSPTTPVKQPYTAKRLLGIVIPVTASRLVGSGSYFLESIMTVQNLALAGVATTVATAQYGILQGMVMPILLLPTALTYSLAVSLVPSLSEAAQQNDRRTINKRMYQSLRLSLVAGAPFAIIMYVLAKPFCLLVFNNVEAGAMLRMMAPVALFIYFQGPLQAALQALEKPGTALMNTMIGAVVKLLLIALLASNPKFGIMGVIIAINLNIALVTVLHWFSVTKMLRFSMPLLDFIKVAIALGFTGYGCYAVWDHVQAHQAIRLAVAIAAGMLIYLLACLWLKLIDRDDAKRLLWLGRKMVK